MNFGPIFYDKMDAFANNKTKIEYGRGNGLRTSRTLGEVRVSFELIERINEPILSKIHSLA